MTNRSIAILYDQNTFFLLHIITCPKSILKSLQKTEIHLISWTRIPLGNGSSTSSPLYRRRMGMFNSLNL